MTTRTADTGAVGSVIIFIAAHLGAINTVVQLFAGLVAIGAGLMAMYYHWKKARSL